jgi:hypothetical protein
VSPPLWAVVAVEQHGSLPCRHAAGQRVAACGRKALGTEQILQLARSAPHVIEALLAEETDQTDAGAARAATAGELRRTAGDASGDRHEFPAVEPMGAKPKLMWLGKPAGRPRVNDPAVPSGQRAPSPHLRRRLLGRSRDYTARSPPWPQTPGRWGPAGDRRDDAQWAAAEGAEAGRDAWEWVDGVGGAATSLARVEC